ncbi:hypothetical protein JZY91_07085 [Corynebacterium sp. CNCTC7651]|uniref:hypothetical protein n=1 Tax=Corynebacterium sp. CNCTC7651 TaxID=2815361 RepID=UPI001F1EF22C|nr:hypothetical protein [Corynebacterium sp. CNCTC7651]UIZ91525.1 hypothetical protein JZY91_07085 [Corynebacterium sp. CNCTC7651]
MAAIQFDVLAPATAAAEVGAAFARAVEILVRRGKLTAGSVQEQGIVRIDDTLLAQLQETYEHDRGIDPEEDGAQVHRFRIDAEGASSVNSLAMGLSRILTPKAELPRDPAALEQQDQFEVASIYPWMVEVLR